MSRLDMKRIGIFVLLCILLHTMNGCYSLRKKFVRKKKRTEEEVYVNFKEYPKPSSRQLYRDYALFIVGWLDELIVNLREDGNYKKEKKAVEEILLNLEQIKAMFNEAGRRKLEHFYKGVVEVQQELKKHPTLVGKSELLRKVESLKREFNNNFRCSQVSQWMEGT